jgi:Protein of unknown function (DUF3105)
MRTAKSARARSRKARRTPASAPPPRTRRATPLTWLVAGDGRPWLLVGGLLLVTLVAIIVVLAVGSGGTASSVDTGRALPEGVMSFDEKDHTHTTSPVTYDRVPPAGGPHSPVPLNCGVYDRPVLNEHAVHSLEHGAVWVTYSASLMPDAVALLQHLVEAEYSGPDRYVLLSPYPGLPAPIVATAWGAQLHVNSATDPRLRQFIEYYRLGPQTAEPGAKCSGGVGQPIG